MAALRATIQPQGGQEKVLKLRLRITVAGLPAGAAVEITDTMLQAGTIASGWAPHVTELPWTTGVAGG